MPIYVILAFDEHNLDLIASYTCHDAAQKHLEAAIADEERDPTGTEFGIEGVTLSTSFEA